MTSANAGTVTTRQPVRLAATVVAAVFLLAGVLGFIPRRHR
jgi:hypothetical protein